MMLLTIFIFKDLEPINPSYNRASFSKEDPLLHPDSENLQRFILGTRFQTKNNNKGHKRNTCRYHDLDLSIQGQSIKSMTQESMQNVRRFRMIQQDKLWNAI